MELLIISGKKTFMGWRVPYLTVGIHARIRWTETVKIVGTSLWQLTERRASRLTH